MTFEKQLLAKVVALPVGEKLPLSRIARELNSSTSVVISGVAALVMSGAIDQATLRPAASPSPSATPTAGVAVPLLAEVEAFLSLSGMAPTTFGKAAGVGLSFFSNLRVARKGPQARTIERVRGFIAAYQRGTEADQTQVDQAPPDGDAGEGEAAPVPGAAKEAGATVARCNPVAPAERPSGTALQAEIMDYIDTGALSLDEFAALMARSPAGLANIAKANFPVPETVTRARAIIAGDRSEWSPAAVVSTARNFKTMPDAEERRAIAETAAAGRLPGETLADAVAREAEEVGARRDSARGSTVVRVVDTVAMTPHHPHARQVPGLSPEIWADIRALAAEYGEAPTAIIPALINRGIDAMRAEAAA